MSEPSRIFIDVADDGSAFTVGIEDGEAKAHTVLTADEVVNFSAMVSAAVTAYLTHKVAAMRTEVGHGD